MECAWASVLENWPDTCISVGAGSSTNQGNAVCSSCAVLD